MTRNFGIDELMSWAIRIEPSKDGPRWGIGGGEDVIAAQIVATPAGLRKSWVSPKGERTGELMSLDKHDLANVRKAFRMQRPVGTTEDVDLFRLYVGVRTSNG